jgi:hypothetical protein
MTDENPRYNDIGNLMTMTADNGAHIDTLGTIFLGFGFLILLLAYMRAQGRNRKLIERLAKIENRS